MTTKVIIICKLKIYEQKLEYMCRSDDSIAIKILASKFLVVMEIMTKHCGGLFYWDTVYISLIFPSLLTIFSNGKQMVNDLIPDTLQIQSFKFKLFVCNGQISGRKVKNCIINQPATETDIELTQSGVTQLC